MNIRFPLSLKVTVWLLLNLLLLGAAAAGFLIAQGGVSWDSLVAGNAGDRLHSLANVIVGEVGAAPAGKRGDVLARFGAEYGVEFLLVPSRGPMVLAPGAAPVVPEFVRRRIETGPPGGPRVPGRQRNMPHLEVPEPDEMGHAAEITRTPATSHGMRFLVRDGSPAAWWIGFRVPPLEALRPGPAALVIRADSLWRVITLLNLESWLLVGASVLVVSVLFWMPLVRSITRDLRALTVATEKIAEGKFDTRVAADRRDELGRLGDAVNVMASRLDSLVHGQKRFLGDIAHELGSPLARLQVATEILEARAGPALAAQVADVREEVQQMTALVNELLAFTQANLRPREAALTPVDVHSLVASVLEREDPGHRVPRPIGPGLRVHADEALLARAVANLVRNALRYAADAGPITIRTERTRDVVTIAVEDEGPGVSAEALARLGEPFYRPELARSRETGGVGLGLAIVRTAVAACAGEVRFANRTPRGFRAEIRLSAA